MFIHLFPNKSTIKLLRIPFSLLLMPIFLLALSQASVINIQTTIWSYIIIHLFIYPASNGYNSYIDRDEGSIGGLEKPPLPTKQLFYITLFLDVMGIILSLFFVNIFFTSSLLLYILASRAYSSKQIRLKKYSIVGFLIVVIFQGGFTFFMSTVGISNSMFTFTQTNLFILIASSLQIAGAYPLTQVYQHQQDLKDGVTTLSYKLGYMGTFIFTAIMFGGCNLFYYLYFKATNHLNHFYLVQLFFIPIVAYFGWWFLKVKENNTYANFKNTMRMNLTAAVCMNSCFILLIFLNNLV